MPSTPISPSFSHSPFGKSFSRSIASAFGAISSRTKRRTKSRNASTSSPRPKFMEWSYICRLPHFRRLGADQAQRHAEIGLRDFLHGKPLVRAEPDDDAGDH